MREREGKGIVVVVYGKTGRELEPWKERVSWELNRETEKEWIEFSRAGK